MERPRRPLATAGTYDAAAMVSIGAVAVAATGWTATVALAAHRLTHPNTAAAVVGGAVMLAGAALGIAAIRQLRVNPSDGAAGPDVERSGLLNVGERCIAVVISHPVVSGGVVAALSVWPAMARAETTVAGALPWGAAQAAAVIAAFVVLGPVLELRKRQSA